MTTQPVILPAPRESVGYVTDGKVYFHPHVMRALVTLVSRTGTSSSNYIRALFQAVGRSPDVEDGFLNVFVQASAPTAASEGDRWFESDADYAPYIARSNAGALEWIDATTDPLSIYYRDALRAQATADLKVRHYFLPAAPASPQEGDLWTDSDDQDLATYRYTAGAWERVATFGASAGTSLFDSDGNVLADADVITSQGTAADAVAVGGVPAVDLLADVSALGADVATVELTLADLEAAYGNTISSAAAQAAAEAARDAAVLARNAAQTAETNAELAQSLAETARTAAQTAQGAAEGARNAAQSAQGLAEAAQGDAEAAAAAAATSQTAAGGSATAAAGSATTANQQATAAAGSATAAAGSASAALASATAANGSATAAASSATTATTQSDAASTSAAAANTSKLAAEAARDAANVSAGAALTSSQTAGAHADDASASAALATSERGLAETARTNAELARDAAITARQDAETAEAGALASELLAVSASAAAQGVATLLIPERLSRGEDFVVGVAAHPVTGATLASGAVVNVAGEGDVRQWTGLATPYTRGMLPIEAGRTYKLEARVRVTVDAGASPTFKTAFFYLDSAYASLGSQQVTQDSNALASEGWRTFSQTVTADALLALNANATWVRARVVGGGNSADVSQGNTWQGAFLRLRDVTSETAAAASASASVLSEQSAAASATAAALSASAADSDRIAAETARTAAQSARDTAVTASEDASSAEAAAASSASLAATSQTAAAGSASAAAGSAATATTQAGIATTQAGAAQTSRLAAEAARDAALGAQGGAEAAEAAAEVARADAIQAETDAEGHATSAASSASTATTQASNAAGSATAAASSATTATSQAAAAGGSAAAAAISELAAAGHSSTAAGHATSAASSATAASGSAAAALSSQQLAAEMVAVAGYSRNATFSDWTSTLPNHFTSSGSPTVTKDTTNKHYGPWSLQVATTTTSQWVLASGTAPFRDVVEPVDATRFYVIEYEVELVSGSFKRAGIVFRRRVDTNNYHDYRLHLNDLHPSPVAGQTYRGAVLVGLSVTIGTPSGNYTDAILYCMNNWTNLNGGAGDETRTFRWHLVQVRPPTALELELQQARGASVSLGSRITNNEAAIVDLDATKAEASALTTLEAEIAGARSGQANLSARLGTLDQARVDGDTALSSRAATLEAQMANTQASGLQSRIATEETARIADSAAISTRAATLEALADSRPQPGTFVNSGALWTTAFGGRPEVMADPLGTFVDVTGEGRVYQGRLGTADYLTPKAALKTERGRTYLVSARVRCLTNPTSGSASVALNVPNGLDSSWAHIATGFTITTPTGANGGGTITAASGWVEYRRLIAVPATYAGVCVHWRPRLDLVPGTGGQLQCSRFDWLDVTEGRAALDEITTARGSELSLSARINAVETASVSGEAALAARATTLEARASARPNLLKNGGFERGLADMLGNAANFVIVDDLWGRSARCFATGTYTLEWPDMPALAGEWYCVHGDTLLLASGGSVYLDLIFRNDAGTILLDGNQNLRAAGHNFSSDGSGRAAVAVETQAPTGATKVRARFVVNAATGSVFGGVRQVKVEQGRLPFSAWSSEAEITEVATVSVDAQGVARATAGVEADVNGRVGGWVLDNNGDVVRFQINADVFEILQSTGGIKTTPFRVVNGQTHISDALIRSLQVLPSSGASISHRVALRPNRYSGADGAVITYGGAYESLPLIQPVITSPPALAAGETYEIVASSVTTSQFTVRGKKFAPGTPIARTGAAGSNVGGTPMWQADKVVVEDADGGNYTFTYNVTLDLTGIEEGGRTFDGNIDLYYRVGGAGSWVKARTEYLFFFISGSSASSYTLTVQSAVQIATAIGQGAGTEFGIHPLAGTADAPVINSFSGVNYTTTSQSSVTALPGLFTFDVYAPT